MRHARRIRAFGRIPERGTAQGAQPWQVVLADRSDGLTGSHANGTQVALESLTRENRNQVDVLCAAIGYRNPGVAGVVDDRTRTRHRLFVSHSDDSSSLFQDKNLFRVFVLMKRDRLTRPQDLGQHEKILRIAVLPVELDREWQAASRTCAAHEVFPVSLLQ